MAAILPAHSIDADGKLSKYFLSYQRAWILDDSPMRLAEKSVRIGWTYADAFKNVRKRLRHPKRDYLFATKDQPSAIEYLKTCEDFARIFNVARSIIARGESTVKIKAEREDGSKFTEEVKFGYIKFDNGSRILAFSSNPYAMAVFGGDVGLDEFAKHPAAAKLWETAQGRVTWGYDLGVWSAHDGTDTLFYQFSREAMAGVGGWSHYKVTLADAIEEGLVEKINETRGTTITREEFMESAKRRARLPEIFEQSYNCNPIGSTSAIVGWAEIQRCKQSYPISRAHLEGEQVKGIFGEFSPDGPRKEQRKRQIESYLTGAFEPLLKTPGRHRLGFDVAASGAGDLAAIYIDRREATLSRLTGLFTCRTEDWDFLKTVLWFFHRRLSGLRSAGDETGLGRQICWETAKQFPGVFDGVNFSGEKHKMGFALMNRLQAAEKIFPADEGNADIAQDFFSMRKIYQGSRWLFLASQNALNPASHCDIAWGGALADEADRLAGLGVVTIDVI